MEMAFSRGLYTGWLRGINNQKLVHGRFGKKRGVYLGEVSGVGCDHVLVRLEGPLKPGDGVGFDAGRPDAEEQGGRVYEVRSPMSNIAELRFGRDDLDFSRIHVGDKLWKTSDPELDRRLRRSFEGDQPRFRWPIQVEVHGRDGLPLTLVVRDELGNVAQVDSAMPLAKAEKQPLTTERLREQLGRFGGTPFKLGELKNSLTGEVLLPVSELNRLRRAVVAELERLRAQAKRWTVLVRSSRREEARVKSEVRSPKSELDQSLLPSAATAQLIVLERRGLASLLPSTLDPRLCLSPRRAFSKWARNGRSSRCARARQTAI